MMDLIHLPLFSLLKKSFINEIKMAAYTDEKLLIVTKSDEVYGLGTLPDSKSYTDKLELRPIPQLHKINVERFVIGESCVFILTENGAVYGWGEDNLGQLGLGLRSYVNEPIVIPSFEGKKIIDISCGSSHAVALCSDQQLYHWGKLSLRDTAYPLTPKRAATLTPKRAATYAIGIAASENAAFYLGSSGQVYGIGHVYKGGDENPYYSIGNGLVSNVYKDWTKIESLSDVKKIVAGRFHVMALNKDGIVFVWGNNKKKQLTDSIPSDQATPVKLSCFSEKIMDIAANSQSDMSVAVTESSKIYVWGRCSGGCIWRPYLTKFTSLEEVFTYYSYPSRTYKGVTFQNVKRDKFIESGTLESIFDEQEDSDLTITVQEKDIHVHKAILKARSKYFLAMFTNQWKESNNKVLKIDGYSYDSFKAFLLYLYTGDIDITTDNVFELVVIADKYSDEALLSLIEKKLNNCSIPDEIVEALKCIMKLSSQNLVKLVEGVKKMSVFPTSE